MPGSAPSLSILSMWLKLKYAMLGVLCIWYQLPACLSATPRPHGWVCVMILDASPKTAPIWGTFGRNVEKQGKKEVLVRTWPKRRTVGPGVADPWLPVFSF